MPQEGFFLDESLSGDITIFVIIGPEMEITENEQDGGRKDDEQARKHDVPRDDKGFMDLLVLKGTDPLRGEKDPENRPEEVDDEIEDLKGPKIAEALDGFIKQEKDHDEDDGPESDLEERLLLPPEQMQEEENEGNRESDVQKDGYDLDDHGLDLALEKGAQGFADPGVASLFRKRHAVNDGIRLEPAMDEKEPLQKDEVEPEIHEEQFLEFLFHRGIFLPSIEKRQYEIGFFQYSSRRKRRRNSGAPMTRKPFSSSAAFAGRAKTKTFWTESSRARNGRISLSRVEGDDRSAHT